jgi:hypothetical protein
MKKPWYHIEITIWELFIVYFMVNLLLKYFGVLQRFGLCP